LLGPVTRDVGIENMKKIIIPMCCLIAGVAIGIAVGNLPPQKKEPDHSEAMLQELDLLAVRLAEGNHKADRMCFLHTKIESHTPVSGMHPNIVIGDDLSICGERFVKAYNTETIRLRNKEKSQPDN